MRRSRLWLLYPVTGLFMIVFSLRLGIWYAGMSVFLTLVVGIMLVGNRFSKNRDSILAPAMKLIYSLEHDDETRSFFEDGKVYYLAMERRSIIDTILGILFLWASVLLAYERLLRSDVSGETGAVAGVVIAAILFLAVNFLFRNYWQRALLHPLLRYNRPISASVACLLEGIYGLPTMRKRAVYMHNAAVGLCRGGRIEESLILCRLARNMAGKHKGSLFMYLNSDTVAVCHRRLGDEEAADREELRKELILEENPLLMKNKDIKLNLLASRFRCMLKACQLTDAENAGEEYLDRCEDDYHRLSMLGLMADVKEALGKEEEASDIRTQLLAFSPENKEVRNTMAYGPCTYSCEKLAVSDRSVSILRILYGTVIAALLFLTAVRASGADTNEQTDLSQTAPYEIIDSVEKAPGQTQASTNPAVPVPEETAEAFPEDNSGLVLVAAEFTLIYPEAWKGLYVEKQLEDGGILVCQKKSYDLNGEGALFSITIFEDGSYVNEPDYEILGYDGIYVYVMKQPTDVTFYMEDEQIRQEYTEMQADLRMMKNSFRILSDSAEYDGNEYIFPNSSDAALQEADLLNLSAEELRIAKNEIYARHGRLFVDTELQNYFDSCSWYRGRIKPDEFDEELLSEQEKSNILMIQKWQ